MHNEQFSKWLHWEHRDKAEAEGIRNPGIYMIALSANNISGTSFSWLSEIIYI